MSNDNICNFSMWCVEIPHLAVFAKKYIGHFETNDIHGEATVAKTPLIRWKLEDITISVFFLSVKYAEW